MTTKKLTKEAIRAQFSYQERVLYWVRRNLVFLVIAVCGLLLMRLAPSAGPDDPFNLFSAMVQLLGKSLLDASIKLFSIFLFMKFALPRIAFQYEIVDNGNIAAAMIFVALVLLVA